MVCETFRKMVTIFKKLFDEDTLVGLLYVANPDSKYKTVAFKLVRASIIHI